MSTNVTSDQANLAHPTEPHGAFYEDVQLKDSESIRCKERELAKALLRDHVLASRALVALQLSQRPDDVRSGVHDAVNSGGGFAELRTRIDTGQTELVLVPRNGSEPLWLTRTEPSK
jgi:hypothetical protein